MALIPCPTHGRLPMLVYMCCRGAKGGSRMSAAQIERNQKGARARQQSRPARKAKSS